jgi:hypothetical protein
VTFAVFGPSSFSDAKHVCLSGIVVENGHSAWAPLL